MYSFRGLNEALVGMGKTLLSEGVWRETRGKRCLEMPHPVLIEIRNPCSRFVTIPQRKWNPFLGFAESLWLAMGLNNLDDLTGKYVKALYNFSDDGRTWRAGYGPRFRFYDRSPKQYDVSLDNFGTLASFRRNGMVTDQFRFVLESFHRDPETRQACIVVPDPNKDCFVDGKLITTKDMPCTRELHFQRNTKGELDLIVKMRSNDILWGFSAVNVFNFTLMQEYFASMLGLPLGKYYHIADNFHVYEEFVDQLKSICDQVPEDTTFQYPPLPTRSLYDFDEIIRTLFTLQNGFQEGMLLDEKEESPLGTHPFFQDWVKVFYIFWREKLNLPHEISPNSFANPLLQTIFSRRTQR